MSAPLSRCLLTLRVLALGLCVPALFVGPSSLLAQDERRADEEARALFEAGRAAFASGRYEEALSRFERAHELSGRPELLYNIAVSADRLRRDARALEAFRRFVAEVPGAETREEIEARIRILEAQLAEPPAVPEPRISPPPEVRPPPPPARPRSTPQRDGTGEGIAVAGGAVAALGLVVAAVTGAIALSTDASLGASCSPGCAPARVDELTALAITTDAALGLALAGAAVLGVGLALHVGAADAREADVAVLPLPGGALLAVRGRLP